MSEMEISGPENGARDVPCFNCRNYSSSESHVPREGGGFHHQARCLAGLVMPSRIQDIDDMDQISACPSGRPRLGFQIGGYYSHMWFDNEEGGGCLEWKICSDGDWPTPEPEISFHLCDFRQLERFVEFWGKELRRQGVIEEA